MAQFTTLSAGDATAQINHFGAQLFSWKVADTEQLFLSSLADHEAALPLRGGIPICFPWFGSADTPFHGFARNHLWTLVSASTSEAVFSFDFTPESAPISDNFITAGRLTLTFRLSESTLLIKADLTNLGQEARAVELGLHGYFRAPANQVRLSGVKGKYLDYTNETVTTGVSEADSFLIPAGVNRIYEGAEPAILGKLNINPHGFTHTVVWNPGDTPGIGDLPDEQALDFVCIEQLYRDPNFKLPSAQTLSLSVLFSI